MNDDQLIPIDYGPKTMILMTEKTKGKTIKGCYDLDINGDDYFAIGFTDGTQLRIRYDWIYEWEVIESNDHPA